MLESVPMKNHETTRNYYEESLATIDAFPPDKKPRLLLHVCCGPCACYPLTFLCEHFSVTIYYGNSNIYPEAEYDHRLAELKRLLESLKRDYGYTIELVIPPYDHKTYWEDLKPYAALPEGGYRCQLCYRKRMEDAYTYADAHDFDYFTTVMTISPQKSSPILNAIGAELETHHKTPYFYSDFKKKGGIDKGVAIRKQYQLYYQDYCGCEASLASRKKP